MRFDFGGPTDGIFQTAFVVEDLDAAMEQFSARMGVGPWTSMWDVSPEGTIYRGAPAQAALHVGFGFSGSMLYELIQPADDHPSVYREVIEERGYGFHHFGYATPDYDAAVARLVGAGFEVAASLEIPTLRLSYIDTRAVLPAMVEFVEVTESMNTSFTAIWKASIGVHDGAPPGPPPAPPSRVAS